MNGKEYESGSSSKAVNPQPEYDWSEKSILIAEDEYPVYFLLENIFEPTKIRITWARSGEEALNAFKKDGGFDAVLLDIRMPGMDGIETFRELRKINRTVPIIAQTAYAMNEEREELDELGFSGFIAKPFVRTEIFELVGSLIK